MSEWIKTSEMVPSRKKKVLIYSKIMDEVLMGKYSLDDNEWLCISHNYNFHDERMQQSITHWQYLTEVPNEQ